MPGACPYRGKMFHQRKHIRLRDFDYSSANAYFITVCVKYFEPLLGIVKNGICGLSNIGNDVALRIQRIPELSPDVILDEFIVMPNHLHLLLIIDRHHGPYRSNAFGKPIAQSVSMLVNHFKGAAKKWSKRRGLYMDWQSRFHDHVIRNEKEYRAIKNYIISNPANWADDKFHP